MPVPTLPAWPAGRPLRSWQEEAVAAVLAHPERSFLASATPAAGKTTFGLNVAHRMLSDRRVARVCVVAPTTHIARQWAADAARYGLDLEPNRPNAAGPEPRDRHGVAVTYQTLAAGPGIHRRRCAEAPTLLIADEPHHMGDQAAWGRSAQTAFEDARFRLLLSGTPFRSDNTPIPWITYGDDGVSQSDFAYGYTDALLDGVCRPVTFHTYDGDMEWMSDGRRRRADFSVGLPAAEAARRLRTALDPEGDWMAHVLRDADARLTDLRSGPHPEAGGLVVAIDMEHAARLAERLARVSGEQPEIVTSETPGASERIARFAAGSGRWLVSVLMVSEGVDVPRLRVGVYATTARTELFFRQVVGRFVRRTPTPREQMSHLFLASDPRLKALAAQVEEERNHALVQEAAGEAVAEQRERAEASEAFRALWSSARRDDDVLRTTAPGDALQLFADAVPAAPPPAALAAFTTTAAAPSRAEGESKHERRERLRDERRALVAAVSRRTGEAHRVIHGRINRETGAASIAAASVDQLERGNRLLERQASKRRGAA
jgi:superfamily II DNA or RNA helicase